MMDIDDEEDGGVSDGDESIAGMTYDRCGTGGTASSTVAGKSTAVKRFDEFLQTKRMKPMEELGMEELCSEPLFQEYGTYLTKYAMHKKKEDILLSWLTCKQLISGVKAVLEKKYKQSTLWANQNWYYKIRIDMDKIVARRCIEMGVPMSTKSEPIGRDGMIAIILALLKSAANITEQRESIEMRAALVMTFAACGRGGECGQSRWSVATWNGVYESLFLLWQELKTSKQKPMCFFPDAAHYSICFYHAMACYFVVGAGIGHCTSLNANQGYIFPFLRGDMKQKEATTKLSKCLKKIQPLCSDLLPTEVSAKCLRVGAVQEVVSRTRDIVVGVVRGGWGDYLASVTTIMEYHMTTHHTLAVGGRALAGWSDPESRVHPPSCEAFLPKLSSEELAQFNAFRAQLFASAAGNKLPAHLQPFLLVCLASLLQYLPQFIADHGKNHLVVTTLYAVAKSHRISKESLSNWGVAVAEKWQMDNFVELQRQKDVHSSIAFMRKQMVQQSQQLHRQGKLIQEQAHAMTSHNKKLDTVIGLLHTMLGKRPLLTIDSACDDAVNSDSGGFSDSASANVSFSDNASAGASVDTHSVVPPPIAIPSRQVNALDLLCNSNTPLEEYIDSTPLFDFFCSWYRRKFSLEDRVPRYTATKYTKGRMKKMLNLVETMVLPPEVSCITQHKGSTNSAEFEDKLTAACAALVHAISLKLNSMGGSKDNKPLTLSSAEAKMKRLKTPKKKILATPPEAL